MHSATATLLQVMVTLKAGRPPTRLFRCVRLRSRQPCFEVLAHTVWCNNRFEDSDWVDLLGCCGDGRELQSVERTPCPSHQFSSHSTVQYSRYLPVVDPSSVHSAPNEIDRRDMQLHDIMG